MTILGDYEICHEMATGAIHISPFNVSQLNPNSYDLLLGNDIATYDVSTIALDPYDNNPVQHHEIPSEGMLLYPNTLYLGHTLEKAGALRDYVPDISGKSSLGRLGLGVHVSAGAGDVGFASQWTLELSVVGPQPVRVYAHMPIAQIRFTRCVGYSGVYQGRYNGQIGATESRYRINRQRHKPA